MATERKFNYYNCEDICIIAFFSFGTLMDLANTFIDITMQYIVL